MSAPVSPASEALVPAALPSPAVLRTRDAWRTDRDVLLLCAFVLLAAALLTVTPDGQGVSVLGWRLPDVCAARHLGTVCPGCGLTRSFVLGVRGDLAAAWAQHPVGPALLLLFAAQLPLRAARLLRARAFARRGLRDPRLARRTERGTAMIRVAVLVLALLWIGSKVVLATGVVP